MAHVSKINLLWSRIKRAKIGYTIFVTIFFAFFTIFAFSSWITYALFHNLVSVKLDDNLTKTVHGIRQIVETSAKLSTKNYLRSLAENQLQEIMRLEHEVSAGMLSEEEAKIKAAAHLSGIKIGPSGYGYIINSQGVLQFHPFKSLNGKDVSDYSFVRRQVEMKQGYIEYEWQNPSEATLRGKVLYMEYYQPWDWIISLSAYAEEFTDLVNPEDFQPLFFSLKIGENGYLSLVDKSGKILIHPRLKSSDSYLSEEGNKVLQSTIDSEKGKLFYDFFESAGGVTKEAVVFYETIKDFGWVVVGTGYIDEFYQPLHRLQKLFIALILLGLFLSVIVSWYLSSSIAHPIKRLLEKLSHASGHLDLSKIPHKGKNEIKELSEYFSEYLDQIRIKNLALHKVVDKQAQTVLELHKFKEVFDHIVEGVVITDIHGTIEQVNPAFERITGYSQDEAIGQNPSLFKSDKQSSEFFEYMWRSIKEKGFWAGEIWNRRKNGVVYPEWLTISAVKDPEGIVLNYAAVFDDITELITQKEKIRFLAYHDHLTKLPNRLMVSERLSEFLSEAKRSASNLICLTIELDNLKSVNDSLGQEKGNKLLKLFVERIKPAIRCEDAFGRIGGDEFALLIKSNNVNSDQIRVIVARILSRFASPLRMEEHVLYITVNIGVAIYPQHGLTADELLTRATTALNSREKETGHGFKVYHAEMEKVVTNKIRSLSKIREGLENHEFTPYYQPKVSLITGEITGVEMLARWIHNGSIIPPLDFIPLAEASGLIIEISWQLFEKAFFEFYQFVETGEKLIMSINISPLQLHVDTFFSDLLALQERSKLAKTSIELEITESVLLTNIEYVKDLLQNIANAGYGLAIDDFGTGYSSLQYLKQLPFTTLKIDQTFVSGIGDDQDDSQIVKIISMLAKQFGMNIVAEGIENQEQLAFLQSLGCDQGQGFFYGKPMPLNELKEWVINHKKKPRQ